jgi:hypothetical protein
MRVTRRRRYILITQGCTSAAFNLALNGAIGWLVFRSVPVVPLWGLAGIAADLAGMAWALPFGTCFAATLQVHRDLQRHRIEGISLARIRPAVLRRLPRTIIFRSVVFGLAGLLTVPPLVALLDALSIAEMQLGVFVAWKALLAMGLALVFTPPVVIRALGDDTRTGLLQRLLPLAARS